MEVIVAISGLLTGWYLYTKFSDYKQRVKSTHDKPTNVIPTQKTSWPLHDARSDRLIT